MAAQLLVFRLLHHPTSGRIAFVTCLLPIVVAMALAADPAARGLPFSVPPGPEDPVISRVAPPQCLFYANLTGTGVPSPSSRSETEKLLAEPEVQEFLKAIGKVITDWLKEQDEEARKCDRSSPADQLAAMVLKKRHNLTFRVKRSANC